MGSCRKTPSGSSQKTVSRCCFCVVFLIASSDATLSRTKKVIHERDEIRSVKYFYKISMRNHSPRSVVSKSHMGDIKALPTKARGPWNLTSVFLTAIILIYPKRTQNSFYPTHRRSAMPQECLGSQLFTLRYPPND